MKINTLQLRDFRGIHELTMNLNSKSAILFGINGVGKSTVLAAINLLYAPIINRLVNQRFKQAVNLELSDILSGKASAMLEAEFSFEDVSEVFHYSRSIMYDNKRDQDIKEIERLLTSFQNKYIGQKRIDEDNNLVYLDEKFNIPIFVNYGVNRLVLNTPLRFRNRQPFDQFSAYEKAIENQIAFSKFFEWFLDQEMYEMQQQRENNNYVDVSLTAVKRATLAMLDGCKNLHITSRPYSMKVTKDGKELDILQLSDGEKCTLALFGDLARRLALANPSLANPLEGEGVVLIDEIELHMHTMWQRKVLEVLKETFPNIQFIITTHSPQVLGEVNGEDYNIFSMSRKDNEVLVQNMESLYGLDTNTVLEDMLGTDSVSKRIKKLVDEMYQSIEVSDYDQAENCADMIDELTLNRNADTVRARIMIRRGRIRNASN